MSKFEKLIQILFILTLIGCLILIFKPVKKDVEYTNKVDSLLIVNDSLSIQSSLLRKKIDSLESLSNKVDSVIVEIEHWYEKELINVTNQPISSDIHFFTEYLSKTDSGFVSSNNSKSVKED